MSHGPVKRRNDETDEEESEGPPPPDGGWGWVVVFASFMIHIMTDGVTYSFGVFYSVFLKYFNEDQGYTSWILSILVGVTLCSGPVSSAFVNKFGCRAVTIAGAILASVCLFISVFAPNVLTLFFTIGIGTGLGFGMIYLPAIVSVTIWFEKYRSLATGIAVCGSGLGTFIFAPLFEYLIAEYDWRGAMMITSAIVLNCIIYGAMFRPVDYENSGKKEEQIYYTKENGCTLHSSVAKTDIRASVHELHDTPPIIIKNGDKITRPVSMGQFSLTRSFKYPTEKNGNIPFNHKKSYENGETSRLALSTPLLLTSTCSDGYRQYGSQNLRRLGPMHRKDIFYQGSLMNIPQYKSKSDLKSTDSGHLERSHSFRSRRRVQSTSEDPEDKLCGCIPAESKQTMKDMLDISLFKDPIFIMFVLSNFLTSIGFNVPYVYTVPKAKSLGIESSSQLLAGIGIANTVGRIVLGYLSDKPWINRLMVYNTCLTICGVCTALSAFCKCYYSLMLYSVIFGFTIGAYVGLTSVILVDLLGLDKLTNAFGILLLFQGIASFLGPPICGWLYDGLRSYDPGFYVAGIAMAISGIMLYAIPYVQRRQEARYQASASLEQSL